MQTDQCERRQYKRIFFSLKDGPTAIFNFSANHSKAISATVMDLSIGGLGLCLKKDDGLIKIGRHLRLTEIKGVNFLKSVADIEMEIKWLRSYDTFQHSLFGCEFLNISNAGKEDIQQFINLWAARL